MAQVIIPYAPRSVFLPFHDRTERFAIGVAHRRAGKTVATINDMIKRAVTSNKEMYRASYIAPFLKQAKDVAWEYLKKYSEPLWAKAPNESELYVELWGGQRLKINGADNPDALRGAYLDDATMDEYADMHPNIWGSVIRPMLSDRRGTATFIGTPKGRNAFYELYQRAQGDPDWFPFFLPASETGIIPQVELDAARKDMTPEQYEQEFECSFEAAIMGAYFGKEIAEAERDGRITECPYEPALPVHTAWDLGVGDSTAIWMFQVHGPNPRIIDHYENNGYAAEHYVEVLDKRGYVYGDDWLPHDARVKEWTNVGRGGFAKSRVETLLELGRKPRIVPAHSIEDGINAARVTLKRCIFDQASCALGLEALRQYRADYDDKARVFRNRPKHDWTSHTADAFRYFAMAWREIVPEPEPPPPVEPRGIKDITFDELMKMQRARKERV